MRKSSGWSKWDFPIPDRDPNHQARTRKYETKNYHVTEVQVKNLGGSSEKNLGLFQVESTKIYSRKEKK